MERIEAETVVHAPPDAVYEFLLDFEGYAQYSEYLTDVETVGEGPAGPLYDLTFSWWRLTYTARSAVTAVDPPERIDWELVRDIDAGGVWEVEPAEGPDGEEAATVHLEVRYDPDSANPGAFDLPSFVSLGWLIETVIPKVEREAERVVERVVHDLEGEPRSVELTLRTT